MKKWGQNAMGQNELDLDEVRTKQESQDAVVTSLRHRWGLWTGEPQLTHYTCFIGGVVLCVSKALAPLGWSLLINRETEAW